MDLATRVAGWLLIGLAGSVGIVFAAYVTLGVWMPVQVAEGHVIWTDEWDRGAVEATGTLTGGATLVPVQLAKLRCERETRACTLAEAMVDGGVLRLSTAHYGVASWNADSIVFAREQACFKEVWTVLRRAGLTGTVTPHAGPGCNASDRSFRLTLSDGATLSRAYVQVLKDRIFPVMWAGLGLLWLGIGMRLRRVLRAGGITAPPPPRPAA